MFKKENFHNETEHKYQNILKRKWGVLIWRKQDRERKKGGIKNRSFVPDLDHWPGICWLHTESSRHSGGCPCRCWQTTCRSRRIWGTGHSSRGGGAGTCQAYCSGAPPHYCSPFWNKKCHNFLISFHLINLINSKLYYWI